MTDTGPRKGLWELMGQKRSEEDPLPTPPASEDPSAAAEFNVNADTIIVPPLESILSPEPPPPPPPAATGPLDLVESLPDTRTRGRGLWQLMQEAENALPTVADDATAAPAGSGGMRSAFEAPVKGADKRLRQLQAPEVEIVDDEAPAPVKGIDKRLRQMQASEVEIVDEEEDLDADSEPVELELDEPDENAPLPAGLIQGIPAAPLTRTPAELTTGLSRNAMWSIILGGISLPVSLIAVYPAIWSRVPPFVCGFGALMLGFLAQGEIQRSQGQRRGLSLAYVGMLTGLFGMFAGPAVYAPLDVYGQWCNYHTRGNLRQIGLATDAYVQQHQTFPSGGLFREVAKGEPEPLHGWMTLLLPHLPEGSALSPQIDYNKPYFDPANQPAMSQTVPTFMAAGGSSQLIQDKYGPAHFAGVGGMIRISDGSMAHAGVFDANSATTRDDILDGASNTMLAGEIAANYPAWGEPKNWRQIGKGLNRDATGFGNARHTGAMFLMADGSVRYFTNETDPKVLQALSTRDGEEKP